MYVKKMIQSGRIGKLLAPHRLLYHLHHLLYNIHKATLCFVFTIQYTYSKGDFRKISQFDFTRSIHEISDVCNKERLVSNSCFQCTFRNKFSRKTLWIDETN